MATIDLKLKTYDELQFEIMNLTTKNYLQQQELDKYKNIVDELEKVLNYDINKSTEYMNRFIGEEQGNYSVRYYRAEWQKEKAIGYLDKLKELKGE